MRIPSIFGALCVLASVAFQPLVAALADEPPADVELRKNVVYGKAGDEELTLHLARPKKIDSTLPVIVYIHGGGWRAGNKDGHLDEIQAAAQRGYISASVGYRFAPAHIFPAQVEDVKCAIRYLRANAKELSLNPERIGAIGYSAGAHLSMMLGTMDSADGLEGSGGSPDQSSKVQAVVAYFGPTNFNVPYPAQSTPIVEQFLGGSREEKAEAYKRASPVTYVNEGDAPTLIFQGTKDILVPFEQAFDMVTALTKAGVPGRAELLFGVGHGWGGEQIVRTQEEALDFFDQHLKK
ncbi:MAG: alpha/beta hydrolase [Pirellulales bacterium]|nr:alpha/beta hydrolase [Pirellulales bacterium]